MQTLASPTHVGDDYVPPFTEPFSSWPRQGRPPGYYRLPLPDEAATFYRDNGFLVVEDCFSRSEIEELRNEATAICRGERGKYDGIEPVQPGESDDDVLRRYLCIHFPHKISDTMRGYVAHPSFPQILTKIIGPNVKCMQSMLFIKASGKPGQAWHQDEYFIPTRDRSLVGGWIAMDDATVENGCLWILPGSHRRGVIWPYRRAIGDTRFDCAGSSHKYPYTDDESVPVEVKAGSIVFFNGYLLHRSLPNYAKSGYRRVLVNHYMSAESLLPWSPPKPGQAMAAADHRDILMVAGEDPYPWKGTEDIHKAHVRPSGEGGCIDKPSDSRTGEVAPDGSQMGGQMGGAQMGG